MLLIVMLRYPKDTALPPIFYQGLDFESGILKQDVLKSLDFLWSLPLAVVPIIEEIYILLNNFSQSSLYVVEANHEIHAGLVLQDKFDLITLEKFVIHLPLPRRCVILRQGFHVDG